MPVGAQGGSLAGLGEIQRGDDGHRQEDKSKNHHFAPPNV
jgi:hypothetical protein